MSTVWEDIDGCTKQYMCDLAIYLMTMLSSSYDIITDCAINAPGHIKNVVDVINTTEKHYLKEQMKLIGKLASNKKSNIGILPSSSKDVSIKFAYQYIHILNNKERLNGPKGSTKMKNIESLFNYQSDIYNVQRKSDVNHRGMKMIWNNKRFPSLNVINGKTSPYISKGILRHYHYRSDPKLGLEIVAIIRIPCNCHACTNILSLSCYSKIKEAVNHPRYGRANNCKYSQILIFHNNWITMNFLDDVTDE